MWTVDTFVVVLTIFIILIIKHNSQHQQQHEIISDLRSGKVSEPLLGATK